MEEKGRRKALKPPGAAGARKPPQQQQRKPPAIQISPLGPPLDEQPLGSPTSPMSPTTRAAVKQVSVLYQKLSTGLCLQASLVSLPYYMCSMHEVGRVVWDRHASGDGGCSAGISGCEH